MMNENNNNNENNNDEFETYKQKMESLSKVSSSSENINNIDKLEVSGENNKREILRSEKVLILLALIVAVLCDRLFLDFLFKADMAYFTAIFEICFIVIFCVLNYEKIYKKPYLWVVAVLLLTLCAWNIIFDYTSNYGILTLFVIPASFMMFTQLATENLDLKNITGIIISWLLGWLFKPFASIIRCVQVVAGTLFPKNAANKSILVKIIVAVAITVPLIVVLIFLLSGADKVFGYYVSKIFASFKIQDFIFHGILIAAGFLMFYSFLWQGKHGKSDNAKNSDIEEKKQYKADNLVLYIILGSVLILYILFCAVQFAYLFASAGLPDGISYAEYAREGFAQIVVISGINLLIFGCMLKFGKIYKQEEQKKDIALNVMLYILVAVTGIMLVSGFTRLGLYINFYGMTFLRLLSAWFIIYLALVLILCVARLIREKLPLIACCAVLLLAAYNILGYINPDAFIVQYNLSRYNEFEYADKWTGENKSYITHILSDDAINALLSDNRLDKEKHAELLEQRYKNSLNKRSFSSMKLRKNLEEFFSNP